MAGLYEQNNADRHMILGSLEVLGEVKNPGLQAIRQNIVSLQQQSLQISQKQENYWKELVDDGVIDPQEKVVIKREMQNIQQSYAALLKQAEDQKLDKTDYFIVYQTAYTNLYTFIYSTLKLFDEMTVSTVLSDEQITKYNSYFNAYYYQEKYTTLALTKGMAGSVSLRVLTNLQEEGVNNEVATYEGNLYINLNNEWKPITTAQYLGEFSDNVPVSPNPGEYFYALNNLTAYSILEINDDTLEINDDLFIIGTQRIKRGYIYLFNGIEWIKINDKKDFRYMSLYTQNVRHVPSYLGAFSHDPNADEGDWYTYSGPTSITRKNGWAYRYNGDDAEIEWTELDPTKDANGDFYMRALKDILKTDAGQATDIGYFNVVFANALMSSKATIGTLQTQVIELKDGGQVKSKNYNPGLAGFMIDGDSGDVEFGNGVFRGTLGNRYEVKPGDFLPCFEATKINFIYKREWQGEAVGYKETLAAMFITTTYNYINSGTMFIDTAVSTIQTDGNITLKKYARPMDPFFPAMGMYNELYFEYSNIPAQTKWRLVQITL